MRKISSSGMMSIEEVSIALEIVSSLRSMDEGARATGTRSQELAGTSREEE